MFFNSRYLSFINQILCTPKLFYKSCTNTPKSKINQSIHRCIIKFFTKENALSNSQANATSNRK